MTDRDILEQAATIRSHEDVEAFVEGFRAGYERGFAKGRESGDVIGYDRGFDRGWTGAHDWDALTEK